MNTSVSADGCATSPTRDFPGFLARPPVAHGPAALAQGASEGHIRSQLLPKTLFRTVVDLRDGSTFSHACAVHDVVVLGVHQTTPTEAGLPELTLPHGDRRSFEIILARWFQLPEARRVLVNMSADLFVDSMRKDTQGWLVQTLDSLGISGDKLLIEITGPGRLWDGPVLNETVSMLRAVGGRLVLGDDGAGHASFRSWYELKPDYVRIGRQWITDVAGDARKQAVVRGMREIAAAFGSQLIAEGVDVEADLQAVLSLGIVYGQGESVTGNAQDRTVARARAVVPVDPGLQRPGALRSFDVIQAPILTVRTTHDEAAAVFQERPELHALAVVESARPVALIPRQQFMNQYARMYFRELHGRKPCLESANTAPCVLERDASIETLAAVLTSGDQRYLSEGFIVTENGQYVGLGRGDQLVRVVTETRLETARHANPLTFLPGNIPVGLHLDRLLAGGAPFVACYADLDNFKPFNDRYGFARGDEMIRLTARLILSNCDPHRDFVGHLGGDDFIVIFQSADWHSRCEAIIERFREEARQLMDEDARVAGGFEAEDRHGVRRFFPCTTVSIGAVMAAPGLYQRAEEVATDAAAAKHDAKLAPSGIAVRLVTAEDAGKLG